MVFGDLVMVGGDGEPSRLLEGKERMKERKNPHETEAVKVQDSSIT